MIHAKRYKSCVVIYVSCIVLRVAKIIVFEYTDHL